MQCVEVCCSVLHCGYRPCFGVFSALHCIALCCSALQHVVVCCNALLCLGFLMCCTVLHWQSIAVCCSALQCIAVSCSVFCRHSFCGAVVVVLLDSLIYFPTIVCKYIWALSRFLFFPVGLYDILSRKEKKSFMKTHGPQNPHSTNPSTEKGTRYIQEPRPKHKYIWPLKSFIKTHGP